MRNPTPHRMASEASNAESAEILRLRGGFPGRVDASTEQTPDPRNRGLPFVRLEGLPRLLVRDLRRPVAAAAPGDSVRPYGPTTQWPVISPGTIRTSAPKGAGTPTGKQVSTPLMSTRRPACPALGLPVFGSMNGSDLSGPGPYPAGPRRSPGWRRRRPGSAGTPAVGLGAAAHMADPQHRRLERTT